MQKIQTLTKADLAFAIHRKVNLSIAESNRIVRSVFDEIMDSLLRGESVKILHFGSFNIKEKKERIGRNPRTMQEFIITKRKVISFWPSDTLKNRINKNKEIKK